MNIDVRNSETAFNETRRIAVLLADRAVQPLPDEEAAELTALLARHPAIDDTELDQAASAVHLAKPLLPESLPAALRARLFVAAQAFCETPESASQRLNSTSEAAAMRGETAAAHSLVSPAPTVEALAFPSAARQPRQTEPKPVKARIDLFGRLGWLAAAACLAIAFAGVRESRQAQKQFAAWQTQQARPDYAALRQALIGQGGAAQPINWTATAYPGMQNVKGDVVWSDAAQQGYMRFVGLPANQPDQLVYQLWIFAANQDEQYPIDGGVFNITGDGEIIVPIKAKLLVNQPSLFAVTIEKPGGVVVSKRDKLALLAKVG